MKSLAELRAALSNKNVQAWLRCIRYGESHDSDARAYMALYGWNVHGGDVGKVFTDFADHPQVYTTLADGRKTSAAGAYQIVYTTWKNLRQRRPGAYPDFSPSSQDLAAVDLTDGRGALEDVIAGRLLSAILKCRQEWTSLPGAMESKHSLATYAQIFRAWGGRMSDDPQPDVPEEQPPAPVEDRSTQYVPEKPMAPFIAAALPALLQAVPSLLTIFANKDATKDEKTAAAATKAVELVTGALGAANAQDMAAKLEASPEARKTAAKAVEENWYTLTALTEVGGGVEAARRAANDPQQPPVWRNPAMIVTLLLLPAVYTTLYAVLFRDGFSEEIRASVVSAIVSGLLFAIVGYWLGTSFGSQRKTDLIVGAK